MTGSGRALPWVLAAGAFAVGIDAVIVSGLLAGIRSSFGVSSGAAGQLITVFGLGYAVLAPTLAPVIARRSRRLVLAGGLLVFAAANALAALAPGVGLLLAARLLASAEAAIYTPAALGQASALAPPGRRMLSRRPADPATVLGINQSALYLGLSLSGVTGALLLQVTGLADLGYTAAGIALAALALSVSSPARPVRPTPP